MKRKVLFVVHQLNIGGVQKALISALNAIDYSQNEDIFVHYSAIQQEGYKSLNEGDLVSYELKSTERGEQAVNVAKI